MKQRSLNYWIVCMAVIGLSACKEKEKTADAPAAQAANSEVSAQATTDNPLLELQHKTVNRAQNSVDEAVNKQQEVLQDL